MVDLNGRMALRRKGGGGVLEHSPNRPASEANDDVQRSIELLDKVLSEFDDTTTDLGANSLQNTHHQLLTSSTSTPQLRHHHDKVGCLLSPSPIGSDADAQLQSSLGHQSEDDGYMSMNGRKAKFSLQFRPVLEHLEVSSTPSSAAASAAVEAVTASPKILMLKQNGAAPGNSQHFDKALAEDFPPPPAEEAQRLIATILPRCVPHQPPPSPQLAAVSPSLHSAPTSVTNNNNNRNKCLPPPPPSPSPPPSPDDSKHSATQTTLPKTRYPRPYVWNSAHQANVTNHHHHPHHHYGTPQHYPHQTSTNPPMGLPPPPRYGSLPYHSYYYYPVMSPSRAMPPRTIPTAIERHREVKRCGSSDDNLSSVSGGGGGEDTVPKPPPAAAHSLRPLNELSDDDEHFSEDSLEETLPLPPPPSPSAANEKRASIAWEVPLNCTSSTGTPPPLTPGSYKVIGRRRGQARQRSTSSSNSINDCEEAEPQMAGTEEEDPVVYWPEPPPAHLANLVIQSGSSTYVLRRPRRTSGGGGGGSNSSSLSSEAACRSSRLSSLKSINANEAPSPKSRLSLDLMLTSSANNSEPAINALSSSSGGGSRSSTPAHSGGGGGSGDGCQSQLLLMNAPPSANHHHQDMVRVVSLPTLTNEEGAVFTPPRGRQLLTVTMEEETDEEVKQSLLSSPLRKIEESISELLQRRDTAPIAAAAAQKSSSNGHINRQPVAAAAALRIQKSESAKEMLIAHRAKVPPPNSTSSVDVFGGGGVRGGGSALHDFPPLPPSPVEEDDDEYSEICMQQGGGVCSSRKAGTLPPLNGGIGSAPSGTVDSLRTRSMDVTAANRGVLRGAAGGRHQWRSRNTSNHHHPQHPMQTSCSLPETPIFARGTPIRHFAPPLLGCDSPRQSSTVGSSLSTLGGVANGGRTRPLDQMLAGGELLRLAGGPARGWYPKQRTTVGGGSNSSNNNSSNANGPRRPSVSIEHLDRMCTSTPSSWDMLVVGNGGGAGGGGSGLGGGRKPQTLPPNLTPKFFQRSPRDALRRVTSLLIRKGHSKENGRSSKDKELVSPTTIEETSPNGEMPKKRGFFRGFWKRSRHYTLEHQ